MPRKSAIASEEQLDLVIDAGPCGAEPTTVIDLTGGAPELMRAGARRSLGARCGLLDRGLVESAALLPWKRSSRPGDLPPCRSFSPSPCTKRRMATSARHFGDPTAWQAGRISLNPLRHIDPVGTMLVPAVILLS